MRYIVAVLMLGLSGFAAADDLRCGPKINQIDTPEQLAQSGCCSHHGGVCGCSGGQAVCCDGAYSPSCGCHSDDKKFLKPQDLEKPNS